MHDPEFEKHVQKKMDELKLDPSDEVWTKVEQEIRKEKRRRPLLWIFLLSALLLGAGYWGLVAGYKNNRQTNIADEVKSKKENIAADSQITEIKSKREKVKTESDDVTINNKSVAENNTTIKPKTSSPQKKSLDDKQSVPILIKNEKEKSKKLKVKREVEDAVNNNISSEKKKDKENIAADSQIEKVKSKKVKVKNEADDATVGNNVSSEKKNDVTSNETKKENENIAADSQINKKSVADKMKTSKTELSGKENIATGSQIKKTSVVKNLNSKKSKSLRLGFAGGAGFSDINKMVSNHNLPAGSALGGTGYNATPSSIQKGISFYAGAFLEKSFSKKVSISAGLNYRYYSTKIQTGKTVDSIIYVPASYFNTASTVPGTLVSRSAYYTSGTSNTYVNHYHFFELPVLMSFQLNNNQKLPLTWQAGLSLSYLINTDALQFDQSSGTYYKDNSLFDKTQVNLLTGFTIGFYRKKSLIEIGPEIQYGATNLLHGYTNNSQHIFYGGLKLSLMPWKK